MLRSHDGFSLLQRRRVRAAAKTTAGSSASLRNDKQRGVFPFELFGGGFCLGWLAGLAGLEEAVTGAGADVVFLQVFADQFDGDGAPAVVGIWGWVVADGVEVGEVVADGGEGLFLVAPVFGEVGFAAGGFGHALEDGGGDGLGLRRPGC